jgi:8-oxo-dGTP pyrophosphatase MutT (NUDIX family)
VSLVAREVEFSRGGRVELYHSVAQADYIAIVAARRDGKIAIVRQYRPALEAFTWELPAGLVDRGEQPIECCRRELLEETGLPALAIHPLGATFPCTGRLSNRIHSFFVEAGERIASFEPEPGMRVKLASPAEIVRLIRAGTFSSQLHIGALLLADMHGFLALPRPDLSPARQTTGLRKLRGNRGLPNPRTSGEARGVTRIRPEARPLKRRPRGGRQLTSADPDR